GDFETILLRENESRRFAPSGVTAVSDSERKFAGPNEPLALERFTPAIQYIHWSFDELSGGLRAEGPLATAGGDFELLAAPAKTDTVRIKSPRKRSLRFDGQLYAK